MVWGRQVGEQVRLYLLGDFRLEIGDRVVAASAWRYRKAGQLVKLLALLPGQRAPREIALDALWPEADGDAAAANLRQARRHARLTLTGAIEAGAGTDPTATRSTDGGAGVADQWLAVKNGLLHLFDGPVWVDVHAFESAAGAALANPSLDAIDAALGLFAGDLLPEDLAEPWAVERRDRLLTTCIELQLQRGRLLAAQGDRRGAANAFQAVIGREPTHELAHVELMRLLAATGQRSAALRQFEKLRGAMRQVHNAEPDPATTRLYQAILNGRAAPAIGEPVEPRQPAERANGAKSHPPAPGAAVPARLSSFIGRGADLTELDRLLASVALVTIVGPPGVGKTSLAQAAATRRRPPYPDGVNWVDLAPLSAADQVAPTIANTFGLRLATHQGLVEMVALALRGRRLLLVLDNCEHLIDEVADIVARLRRGCPEMTILATSRQRLGVTGEVVYTATPFAVPDDATLPIEAEAVVEAVMAVDSVRLFVERARLQRPNFCPTPRQGHVIAQICRRLDGLPLAIELAAAQLNTLSVDELKDRLDNRFRLLVATQRDAPARHRTLQVAIEASYDRLDPRARDLLNRLTVFAGGFTRAAAEAICPDPEPVEQSLAHPTLTADEIEPALATLLDHSLVTWQIDATGRSRYLLLESIREFAQARVAGTEVVAAVADRHAEYWARRSEALWRQYVTTGSETQYDEYDREQANLRAAFAWACQRPLPATALELAGYPTTYWENRDVSTASGWVDTALRLAGDLPLPQRAGVMAVAAVYALMRGNATEAYATANRAVAIARQMSHPYWLAEALAWVGISGVLVGELDQAETALIEAMAIQEAHGQYLLVNRSKLALGRVAQARGDLDRAEALMFEALAEARARGWSRGTGSALSALGGLAAQRQEWSKAADWYREGCQILADTGDTWRVARGTIYHGAALVWLGDRAGAIDRFREGLWRARRSGAVTTAAWLALELGGALTHEGNPEAGARSLREGCELALRLNNPSVTAVACSRAATWAQAIGQSWLAAELLSAAAKLRAEANVQLDLVSRHDEEPLRTAITATLGVAAYDQASAAGRVLSASAAYARAINALAIYAPTKSPMAKDTLGSPHFD